MILWSIFNYELNKNVNTPEYLIVSFIISLHSVIIRRLSQVSDTYILFNNKKIFL